VLFSGRVRLGLGFDLVFGFSAVIRQVFLYHFPFSVARYDSFFEWWRLIFVASGREHVLTACLDVVCNLVRLPGGPVPYTCRPCITLPSSFIVQCVKLHLTDRQTDKRTRWISLLCSSCSFVATHVKERIGKEVDLHGAYCQYNSTTKRSDVDHTELPANTPHLPFLRIVIR